MEWRVRENRARTVSAAILLCLHIGVDPPDLQRTNPTSHIQAFCDTQNPPPTGDGGGDGGGAMGSSNSNTSTQHLQPQLQLQQTHSMIPMDEEEKKKAAELTITRNIQKQYEHWQPRCRYKCVIDPTTEECKRLLSSLRKASREERILFHYNGHGVPKPTAAGELWMFNRQFTQYIPISIQEIHSLLSGSSTLSISSTTKPPPSPSIIVLDCPDATIAQRHFVRAATAAATAAAVGGYADHIVVLASSSFGEPLPQCPTLPQDLFTSCLTSPIRVAQQYHQYKNGYSVQRTIEGSLLDRRSPLGFLNWQFTAITDAIAWSILPPFLFRSLFREDVLVASMMRNFLFATRIMNSFSCRTSAYPPISIPAILKHPLWDHWDLIMDSCFSLNDPSATGGAGGGAGDFFIGQMDLMELVMESDDLSSFKRINLPIILQILLSQSHRLRALELLAKYLNFEGRGHEGFILQVGIHPYLLKLFQSTSKEIRRPFLRIWLHLLRWDKGSSEEITRIPQADLNYFQLFIMEEGVEEDIVLLSLQCHHLLLTYNPKHLESLLMSSKDIFLNRLQNLLTPLLFQPIIQYLTLLIERLYLNKINRISSLFSLIISIINRSDIHYKVEKSKLTLISFFGSWLLYLTMMDESLDKGQRIIMPILINFLITDPSSLVRLECLLIINRYLGGEKNLLLPKQLLLTSFEFSRGVCLDDFGGFGSFSSGSTTTTNTTNTSISITATNTKNTPKNTAIKGDFVRGRGLASTLWKSLVISSMDPVKEVSSISRRILEGLRHRRFINFTSSDFDIIANTGKMMTTTMTTKPLRELSLNSKRNPNIFLEGIRSFAFSTQNYIYLLGKDSVSLMGGANCDDSLYEFEASSSTEMILGPPLVLVNLPKGTIIVFDNVLQISNAFRMLNPIKKAIFCDDHHLFIVDSFNFYTIYSIEERSFIKEKSLLSIEPSISIPLPDGSILFSNLEQIIRFDFKSHQEEDIVPSSSSLTSSLCHSELFFYNGIFKLRDGDSIITFGCCDGTGCGCCSGCFGFGCCGGCSINRGNSNTKSISKSNEPVIIKTDFHIIASDLGSNLNILFVKDGCASYRLLVVDESFLVILKTIKVVVNIDTVGTEALRVKIAPNYDLNRIGLLINEDLRIYDLY